MFEEYAGQKVLELFFKNPYNEVHLRGIARQSKVSPMTAKIQLDKFVNNSLVKKNKKANLTLFKANIKNRRFQMLKTVYSLEKIENTGIIKELKTQLKPLCIVLYGSTSRGEDDTKSDLDLLVISKKKKDINLSKFEKKLGKEINYIVYNLQDWEKKATVNKPFYQRILIEGIALYGDFPVIE